MPDDELPLDYLPHDDPRRAAARHREMVRLRAETLARHQDKPAVQEWLRQFRNDGQGLLEYYADGCANADPEAVQSDDFQDYEAFRRYLLLRGHDCAPACWPTSRYGTPAGMTGATSATARPTWCWPK